MSFDPKQIEDSLQTINSVEENWGLPPLPDTVKLDLSTLADAGANRYFLNDLAHKINVATTQFDQPQPEQLVRVQSGSPLTGPMARGLSVGLDANLPYTQPGLSVPSEPVSLLDGFNQFAAGVMGAAPLPSQQRFSTQYDFNQKQPYIRDPQAVQQLKRQAVEMGLLPEGTRIDGTWDPSMNAVLREMANEDFSRAVTGQRPGALNVRDTMLSLGELVSPDFAFMVTKEVVRDIAKGFWWDPADIGDQWRDNWAQVRQLSRLADRGGDVSTWDMMGAYAKAMFGTVDDVVLPVINWGLMLVGVGEVAVGARVLLGGMKGVKATTGALQAAGAARAATQTARGGRIARTLFRGLDEAAQLAEYERWVKAGRVANRLQKSTRYGRYDPVGKIEAWRGMKGVMLSRKATQQMMRFSQAQMAMAAVGDNPADQYVEGARNRYEEWARQNIGLSATVGVLSGAVMPRNIYRQSTLFAETAEKARNLKQLTQHEHLYDAGVAAIVDNLSKSSDPAMRQRAVDLANTQRTGGSARAWKAAMFGTEGTEIAEDSQAVKMLWEATVSAAVEHRARTIVQSMGDYDSLSKAQIRRRWFMVRNKLLQQMDEWDPQDMSVFEAKLNAMLDEADLLGKDDVSQSLLAELRQWADADDATRQAEFATWALRANENRNVHLGTLLQEVMDDPSILEDYLRRNPTWMDARTYGDYHLAWGELSHWITGTGENIDWAIPMARGSRAGGRTGGPAVKDRLRAVNLDERRTLSTINESDRFPSISELVAPGGDDGVRAAAGVDVPGLDEALRLLFDGKLDMRSSLLGSSPNANVLYRTLDDPEVGQFALAKSDTMTGNEALVFIDHIRSITRHQRLIRSLNRGAVLGMRKLGRKITAAGTDVTRMTETQFRAFVTRTLGGRGSRAFTKTLEAQLSTDSGVKEMQSLFEFMQRGGVDMSDLRTVEAGLDARLRNIAGSDLWYDSLGVDDVLRASPQNDVVVHLDTVLDEADQYAKTLAHDVADAPQELVEFLADKGYKPVIGKEFIEPTAIGRILDLNGKLPGLNTHSDIGKVALSLFMPDSLASLKLFDGIADKAGRFAAWAMRPGERQFIAHYEKVLKMRLALRLNQSNSDRFTSLSWEDKEIDTIYRWLWDAVNRNRYTTQSAIDANTGFRLPSRVTAAFTPQTIRDTNPRRVVEQIIPDPMRPNQRLTEVWDAADIDAIERAIRDSLFTGWDDEFDRAFQLRGPMLMAEDWFRAHGLVRGMAVGLPLLFGSAMRKPMREVAEMSQLKKMGLAAGGTAAFNLTGELLDSEEGVNWEEMGVTAAGAALGTAIGGRPMRSAVGALGGQSLTDGDPLGSLAGGLIGGATSTQAARNMESRLWQRGMETSQIGRVAGAIGGAAAGSVAGEEMGLDEGGQAITQGLGAALGQFGAPMMARAIRPMSRLPNGRKTSEALLEFMRFNRSTMTNRAFNLTMAMRFTLSPLFDMQRHLELASFAFLKETPEGVSIPLRPWSRNQFVKNLGEDAWHDWAGRFDNVGRRVHRGIDMGNEAGEVSARMFRQAGILGFNPTDKSISIFRSLVTQGMGEDEAFRLTRKLVSYGVEGRTTGELTVNAIFFPFSFQARYVGRWAKYLQDDVLRTHLIAEGVRTFNLLDEKYDLDAMFAEHLPVMDQLNKLNAFGFGLSPGEFGGIHRPWINFFVPVATLAVKTAENSVAFSNPYSGIEAVGEGFSRATEQVQVDGQQLVNRLIPVWRDMNFLLEDLKEQGHVVFSPHHMTTQAESTQASQQWQNIRDSAERVATGQGFPDLQSYTSSRQGEWLAEQLRRERARLSNEYPVWEEAVERGVALSTASRYSLAQRAKAPTEPVDYDIRLFEDYLDALDQNLPVGYDINDISSLPASVQEQVREFALQLANRDRGFDMIWDKYYRRVWGPIDRPVYLSLPVEGQKVATP